MRTTRFALFIISLILAGCSTTGSTSSLNTAQLKSDAVATAPIVEAGISAAGGQYGPLAADLYGMAVQAWAQQPVANGASNAAIGAAVAQALPAGSKTGAVAAAMLTAAANQAQAKVP